MSLRLITQLSVLDFLSTTRYCILQFILLHLQNPVPVFRCSTKHLASHPMSSFHSAAAFAVLIGFIRNLLYSILQYHYIHIGFCH